MHFLKKKLILGLIGLLLILCMPIITEVLLPINNAKTYTVKLTAGKVLFAQLLANITEGYWDDEMTKQAKIVKSLSLQERMNFFSIIIIHCDLDTYRGLLFLESVGKDALNLKGYLINQKESGNFYALTHDQRLEIDRWISELDIFIQQGGTL